MPCGRRSRIPRASSGVVTPARRAIVAWTILATLWPVATSAHAAGRVPWTVWLAAQAALSRPTGDFHPSGQDGSGLAFHASLAPPNSPLGIRQDAGGETRSAAKDSVLVPFLFGSQYNNVEAENATLWASFGAQWDPRPRGSSGYLYATVGGLWYQPTGHTSGPFLIAPDLPGMPAGSTTFAWSVGLGGRVVLGKSKRLALSAEMEYRRSGVVDYIDETIVGGSFPDTHYATDHRAIELVIVRVGIAAPWRRL